MGVAEICADLVRIRSENPPGGTADVIEYIEDFLDRIGIRGLVTRNRDGRCNLVVNSPDTRLLLCGHVDVVPALADGWTRHPFSGDIEAGCVWGRGSTDMKGGCASILHALRQCANEGAVPRVNLAFVCDEETGGEFGVRYLLSRNLLSPCDCVIAEPTPQHCPSIGQKGLCRLRFDFSGEPGHGSLYPHIGVSAVMEAFDLLEYMKLLNTRTFSGDEELLGIIEDSAGVLEEIFGLSGIGDALRRITFNPGRIEGGEKANIIAQECLLELDIRIPWGCDVEHLLAKIAAQAARAAITPLNMAAPSYTPSDTEIVAVTCREIERVTGYTARPIVQWAASDARYLRKAGFDVLEYGPGDLHSLHAIDEQVPISQLESAADVYRGIIGHYSLPDAHRRIVY
ncbi:MAG: M20/M25/M40 family metallo-hydrolase [Methanomicrobiaceae archaeon]|nr:M20/M25/M40 family metallo-hydrolase [Methanomicrobiaceae archaeon]